MGVKLKKSTKNVIRMHGSRIDRAIHNYLYFTRYDTYVKYFLKAGRLVIGYFGNLRLAALAFKGGVSMAS